MQIGARVNLGRIRAVWPQQVRIGEDSLIQDGTIFDYCHGNWSIGPSILIGTNVYIGRGTDFNCRRSIRIGNDCLIAAGCRFVDHDHGIALDVPIRLQCGPEAPIELEDGVWLGANVVVLKGVRIGQGAVVAAGAIVTKSIPPLEIWAGVPARRIARRAGPNQ